MASRAFLHEELVSVLGSRNVYFQPPDSVKLNFPCILYSKSRIVPLYANDKTYTMTNEYFITVIDKNPDSDFAERILTHFSHCRFDRSYIADNLYHQVLTLYY